jgi:Fe-S-cluster containining protein
VIWQNAPPMHAPRPESSSSVAAGPFAEWLAEARASLLGDGGADVPCGDCVGCCVSSYFIPIRPQDEQALAVIPVKLLVNAPGAPSGHLMMGYSADGHCPMLSEHKCTIYGARPQTCRDYDCRIFAAAGIVAGGPEKSVINQRVQAWEFSYPTESDRLAHRAVLAAAKFIREKRASFPNARAPTAPTGIAVLALKVYKVFLDAELSNRSDPDVAWAIIKASGQFDAAGAERP